MLDRNIMRTSSNWTGRTPRTMHDAFPRTVRPLRTVNRARNDSLLSLLGAAAVGAAFGVAIALHI